MKKRLLSLLLILCLCAALLPVTALAAETTVTDETDLRTALSKGGTVKLGGNIKLAAALEINNTVTLDLNGYEIARGEYVGVINAVNIKGGGHLTLTDSSNGIGAISDFDGSVHVLAGGTFTMNGGRLLAGRALGGDIRARGGGVLVDKDGLFVMNGGSIESCLANGDGGGVYVNGILRMTGGTIYNCGTEEAVYDGTHGDGGGVFIAPNGTFEMSGGSIENCYIGHKGKGGGVYVGGKFTMTGGMIKNNVVNKAWGGEGAGVYVANGATATLIPENITGNKKSDGTADDIAGPGGYTVYEPDTEIPDYPLISILPALTKDLPFTDVTSTDWFYNDVKYAYENGLMTGTSGTAFSPEAPVTRGMVMTILARREGIRTDRYTPWYAAGCEWAKANGISDGSNPEAPVIREQLAAMLYRYAALKGRDLTAGENLNFTDASDVSAYALPALQWATGEKILTGSNGALNPQATATRAHLAAILHRYFG
mgnify:CR=1 FL=1|jgi:hypothetical protein